MLRTLAKGYAYTHRPQLTFAALHPKEAVRLKKMEFDLRHAYAPRVSAAAVLLVALPLGIWIGRRWERTAAHRATRVRARGEPVRPSVTRRSTSPRPTTPTPSRPSRAPAGIVEWPAPGELRR